jgi:hypothetical protein
VTDTRVCAQCAAVFTPRREHARFCSAGCRLIWHRDRTGDPIAGDSVLQWSVPSMTQAIRALTTVTAHDLTAGYAAISDAVWAVTMVDAAMVRRHPGIYDEVLASEVIPDRRLLEETLGGLRFVRNWIPDHAAVARFIGPAHDARADDEGAAAQTGVTDWLWQPVSKPGSARHRGRAQVWELARYDAYRVRLAGRPVAASFDLAEAFLLRTAAGAAVIADLSARPTARSAAASRRV